MNIDDQVKKQIKKYESTYIFIAFGMMMLIATLTFLGMTLSDGSYMRDDEWFECLCTASIISAISYYIGYEKRKKVIRTINKQLIPIMFKRLPGELRLDTCLTSKHSPGIYEEDGIVVANIHLGKRQCTQYIKYCDTGVDTDTIIYPDWTYDGDAEWVLKFKEKYRKSWKDIVRRCVTKSIEIRKDSITFTAEAPIFECTKINEYRMGLVETWYFDMNNGIKLINKLRDLEVQEGI